MAELTHLDEKLAEVLGLAQAAQAATKKVATLARRDKDTELLELMQRMGDQAAKVEQRCDAATSYRDGVRTAIANKARETKTEVNQFMRTYLEDAEALDGLEFLSMAEAGELAHWEISTNSTKPRTTPRSTRSSSSPWHFSRRASMPSENSRCGSPANKTPPSRHKPDHATSLRLDDSRPESDPMAHRPIDVYLNDHLAGAPFGADLARQLEARSEGTDFPPEMSRLAAEIEADLDTLTDLMKRMGATPAPSKQVSSSGGEPCKIHVRSGRRLICPVGSACPSRWSLRDDERRRDPPAADESGIGTAMPSGRARPQRSATCQSVSSNRSSTRDDERSRARQAARPRLNSSSPSCGMGSSAWSSTVSRAAFKTIQRPRPEHGISPRPSFTAGSRRDARASRIEP